MFVEAETVQLAAQILDSFAALFGVDFLERRPEVLRRFVIFVDSRPGLGHRAVAEAAHDD